MQDKLFIGADVSQNWVAVAVSNKAGPVVRVDNTLDALCAWAAQFEPGQVWQGRADRRDAQRPSSR